MKRIDVIGFGPGNYDYMTIEAVQALKEADVIVGYSTVSYTHLTLPTNSRV